MTSIFLSYAREDKRHVDQIYLALRSLGLNPWMDNPPTPYELEGISPGQEWDTIIRRKIKEARLVLIFLSTTSISKKGYIQREYRLALSYSLERPSNDIYIMPILLEDCQPPDIRVDTANLSQFQWYPLHKKGIPNLINHIRRASKLDLAGKPDLENSDDTLIILNNKLVSAIAEKYSNQLLIEYLHAQISRLISATFKNVYKD
jgi:hypothetical protein